jgi:hypothetical protein
MGGALLAGGRPGGDGTIFNCPPLRVWAPPRGGPTWSLPFVVGLPVGLVRGGACHAENTAVEIRLMAARKGGELLAKMEEVRR